MQLRTAIALCAVLVLGLPAAAHANGAAVIRDCADDGQLSKHYSHKDLQDALNNLPSDINEYTDCASVIRAALAGGNGDTNGPPANAIVTPSGAVAASPADVAALAAVTSNAAKGKAPTIHIGGAAVVPGNAGLSGVLGGLAGANGMPTSLVAAIAAFVILAAVIGYLAVREKALNWNIGALRIFRR